MKHPGKQGNEGRVLTASLCICHLINQVYVKSFRNFIIKLILWAAILPRSLSFLKVLPAKHGLHLI